MSRLACLWLVCLVVAGMVTGFMFDRHESVAQEAVTSAAKKWEYKVVRTSMSDEQLTQMGEEGWELVQIIPAAKYSEIQGNNGRNGGGGNGIYAATKASTEFCAYFKRPR